MDLFWIFDGNVAAHDADTATVDSVLAGAVVAEPLVGSVYQPLTTNVYPVSSTTIPEKHMPEPKMADIRVQVPDSYMSDLREKLNIKSNPELIKEALTLISWAVEEKVRGRLILSSDKTGGNVERLAMSSLSKVKEARQLHA